MAIERVDPGGEYYFSAGINAAGQWNSISGATVLVNSAPVGRTTQYAISMISGGSFVDWTLGANFPSLVQGGAVYIPVGGLGSTSTLIQFLDGTTPQCDVRLTTSGTLQITRNGTVLGTSTLTITSGSGWHYVEFQANIATGTGGSAQVWVDNVSYLSVSSVNTSASGNAFASHSRYGWSGGGGVTAYWKDMYVLDTGTGTFNSRLGDQTIQVIYPNAAGPQQAWGNFGGATQTASVQDGITHTGTWPDGDTTYIFDATSGQISDFQHQALGSGTLSGIVHASYCRNDSGAANFEQYCNSAGNIHTTSSIAAGSSYNYFFDVQELDPTGSAWTVSSFNAATFGIKIP